MKSRKGGQHRTQPRVQKTLERLISKAGIGSRTEARSWIHAGRVTVNGKRTENPDKWVNLASDIVVFDGKRIDVSAKRKTYLLLNKPTGYVTTYKDPEGRPTVYDLLPSDREFLFPVGRLDLDTSGLLLITNDSEFAEHITNPDHNVSKTYLVKASPRLAPESLDQLALGVTLSDGPTRPAIVKHLRESDTASFIEITISEGRNRQVRRMLQAVGSKVRKLVRVSIGPLALSGLEPGAWRELTPAEVRLLERKQ